MAEPSRIAPRRKVSHIDGREIVDCIMFRGQLLAACVDGAAFVLSTEGEWRRLVIEPTIERTADLLPFRKP